MLLGVHTLQLACMTLENGAVGVGTIEKKAKRTKQGAAAKEKNLYEIRSTFPFFSGSGFEDILLVVVDRLIGSPK